MNTLAKPESDRPKKGSQTTDEELAHIRESLRGLRFGSVHITVQDGVIVQIDRTEKRRLRGPQTNTKEQ